MIQDLIVSVLLVSGGVWTFVAALGIVRMPDLLTRAHPATKASTLGLGSLLLAMVVHFVDVGVATRALLVLLFVFLGAPVAAHRLGRAAYNTRAGRWPGLVRDDLHDAPDRTPPPDEGTDGSGA